MATSGSFNTNSYESRYYTVSWTDTLDDSLNKSSIHWTITAAGYTGWVAERTVSLTINGTSVYYKTDRVERYPGQVASGWFAIQHDSQGNATMSMSLQVAVYDSSITAKGSASFTLDQIDRGIVYIHNGSSFASYQCYIYNGSSWATYAPYIYNGSSWVLY